MAVVHRGAAEWLQLDHCIKAPSARPLTGAEEVEPPLHEALQLARERFPRRGQPDTCLVISHANRAPTTGGGFGGGHIYPHEGRGEHQCPSDNANLARPAPRGRGGQGGQRLLRHCYYYYYYYY